MEIYKDRDFLYEHYVTRRMNISDIAELIEKKYGTKITTQGLYNWIKKYDLLKYRGKGRKLGANLQHQKSANMPKSPAQLRAAEMRKIMRQKKRHR